MSFSHAHEAVYGGSKCKFCENHSLKILCTRLAVFEESFVFHCHALEAGEALHESTTWGLDVELKAMESEQTGLTFSPSLAQAHMHEFAGGILA